MNLHRRERTTHDEGPRGDPSSESGTIAASEDEERVAALLMRWQEALELQGTLPESFFDGEDTKTLLRFARLIQASAKIDAWLEGTGSVDQHAMRRERIGPFTLLWPLGQGGTGHVFACQEESLGRLVALKVVRFAEDDPTSRHRLRREAEITASLDHPHVVPIYRFGETESWSYMGMKLLSGPSLDELPGPITGFEVATLGASVASALEDAHSRGILHRDVKPSNIVLHDGQPMLVDFGLAREVGRQSVTRAWSVAGTLCYMSPEQLAGHQGLDPRSDIYSLGATLYELLVGAPPFEAPHVDQLIRGILDEEPPPMDLDRENAALGDIVLRALEKDPQHRFQTARAFCEALQAFASRRRSRTG